MLNLHLLSCNEGQSPGYKFSIPLELGIRIVMFALHGSYIEENERTSDHETSGKLKQIGNHFPVAIIMLWESMIDLFQIFY